MLSHASGNLHEIGGPVRFRGGKKLLASPIFGRRGDLRRGRPTFVPQSRGYGVEGIAIDRFDGSIVGQQLEEVTE